MKGEKEEKLGHFLSFHKKKSPMLLSEAKCWVLSGDELLQSPGESQMGGRSSVRNNGSWVSDRPDHPTALGHMELPTDCHYTLSF